MAIVAPSFEDMLTVGKAEAQDRRPDLVFNDGDVTEADLHAAAAMADNVIRFGVLAFKRTFIDTCEGDDLDALINDHLNIQRIAASKAQVTLQFTRTSGGAAGTIPIGTVVTTDADASGTSESFQTTAAIIVPLGNNGPFTVNAEALDTGPEGNVTDGTLVNVTGLFDATFTVTNPATAGGGNNRQSDEEYRETARSFWQSLRRGTLGALETGARTVITVRSATAVEDSDTGLVTVLVSDADGNSTLQMINDVTLALEDWRCAGQKLQVTGGSRLTVDMSLGLVVRAGFDVDAVAPDLVAAAVNRVNRLPGGPTNGTLYQDMVSTAIIELFPDDIKSVEFLTVVVGGSTLNPIVDPIVPGVAQVIRAGTFTVQEV